MNPTAEVMPETRSNMLKVTRSVSIPIAELRFRYVASQGPGGQHVNRSNTQVELFFNVAETQCLTDIQRTRIIKALGRRISKEGILQIAGQTSRSQKRNKQQTIGRLVELLKRALYVPKKRKPTKPSRASKERRLQAKKRRSVTKRLRGCPGFSDND